MRGDGSTLIAGLRGGAVEVAGEPPDRVHVDVFRHPEHSTPATGALLDTDGRIDLPLVGPVPLAGLTLDEARARITGELERFIQDPQVSFYLLDNASRRFYVFGEVAQPGARLLDRPLTALQALSLAGGFRPGADGAGLEVVAPVEAVHRQAPEPLHLLGQRGAGLVLGAHRDGVAVVGHDEEDR